MARRKGNRWSRRARDDPRRSRKRPSGSSFTYDPNAAGEPMLSWAQAQQTVKLMRGQSADRFTISSELAIRIETSHKAHYKEKIPKSAKKSTTAQPTAKDSYDTVEHWQKTVDKVQAPPDAHQETYVCDEEDHEMLKMVNAKKRFNKHGVISAAIFEDVITQLERESSKCRGVNLSFNLPVDEDAVCCVCQKGDCDNTNMILFCDGCNLAVHQECYGVPYIPEGPWKCRRCQIGGPGTMRCKLCPSTEGAFKQTEDGHWVHVICALYMPKVNFKSTQLLEPVMNLDKIEKSRWKLKCAVCKEKEGYTKDQHVGACIQCEEAMCTTAFHVTCAQKAGYYMELKPSDVDSDSDSSSEDSGVKALAYCKRHSKNHPAKKERKKSPEKSGRSSEGNRTVQQSRMDSLNIDPEKLYQIATSVKLHKTPVLFNLIICYWKSKRCYRNNLPLLKRPKGRNAGALRMVNQQELEQSRDGIKQALRWAEKLRTLTEYRLRQDKINFRRDKLCDVRQCFEAMPGKSVLDHVFNRIKTYDKDGHFGYPVTEKIAPQYFSIVKHPMDLSTMAKKMDDGLYNSFESFSHDVNLIIDNCLKYNTPDTIFHDYAVKFREAVKPILETARKDYDQFVEKPRTSIDLLLSSPLSSPTLASGVLENGIVANGMDDDLLSEISHSGDTHEPKSAKTSINALPSEMPSSSSTNEAITSSEPVAANTVSSSLSPNNSRAIPSSPRSRKTPVSLDDSNEIDAGTPRKRARTTPADSDEAASSSNQVPASQSTDTSPPRSATLTAYRSGRLITIASESEPDPPFASEDSTDLPSSDYDMDSDGPAFHLRRKDRSYGLSREYIEIRPGDFVWAKGEQAWYPAIVVDPRSTKGLVAQPSGHQITSGPPSFIINEKKNHEKKSPGVSVHLVNFFDRKRKWSWVQHDNLDLLWLDDSKDKARLLEPKKLSERKSVQKAYDLARKFMNSAQITPEPQTNGNTLLETTSPPGAANESDADED